MKKPTPTKSDTRKKTRPLATGTGRTSLRLSLPDELREKLADAAVANGSSLNDEIIYRLIQSLQREGTRKRLSDSLKSQGDHLAKVEEKISTLVKQLRLSDD